MILVTTKEFKEMLIINPTKRFAFLEYVGAPCLHFSDINWKGNLNSPFGATSLEESNFDFPFDYDWNIDEYREDELFYILEEEEILSIIKLCKEAL